jgi:capsular polysaccharide export protein
MAPAIDQVFESFAAHADPAALLVVKSHPLDNGLRDWKRVVLEAAKRTGLSNRILYLEDGDIELLVRAAEGVVTVNSTTGTLALAHGVPVTTLGRAVYDIPRVTHQGGLDKFWTAPDPHEPAVFDALRRVLIDRCLIHGGFFSDAGLEMLVEAAIPRLLAGPTYRPALATTTVDEPEAGFLAARVG